MCIKKEEILRLSQEKQFVYKDMPNVVSHGLLKVFEGPDFQHAQEAHKL